MADWSVLKGKTIHEAAAVADKYECNVVVSRIGDNYIQNPQYSNVRASVLLVVNEDCLVSDIMGMHYPPNLEQYRSQDERIASEMRLSRASLI